VQAEPSAARHPHDRRGDRRAVAWVDDDNLLRRARAGHPEAFGELYTRHHHDALRYAGELARRYSDPGAADDILAEAVRKILSAVAAGAGPLTNFRQYLFTCVRSVAIGRARELHRTPVPATFGCDGDRAQDVVDMIVASDTFRSLPQRWRHVLWATTVDERTPAELAPALGMRPNSVAVLAYRARTAFRTGYLDGN
jgi:RNA polymerase sigma factor (sigma-70 family)